jgi:putative nucleotidyltransferase with HDIG domain
VSAKPLKQNQPKQPLPAVEAPRALDSFKSVQESKLPKKFNDMLERLQDIPTLPVVATRINELINDPESSAADIAEVLKKDQVLTAKVLKLINSPYYGIPGGVTEVQRALAFLGFNTIAQLVLGLSVFSLFPSDGQSEGFSIPDFWKHALGAAVCSEQIAKRINYPRPEEAFTCGLLHDIGKLVMYQIAKPLLLEIVASAKSQKKSFVEIERDMDVPGHGFLGEHIAAKWGLPQVIRGAIRYHHQDVRQVQTLLPVVKQAAQIVSLANGLVVSVAMGHSGDYSDGGVKPWMHEVLGLGLADVEEIKKRVAEESQKAGAFLNV